MSLPTERMAVETGKCEAPISRGPRRLCACRNPGRWWVVGWDLHVCGVHARAYTRNSRWPAQWKDGWWSVQSPTGAAVR